MGGKKRNTGGRPCHTPTPVTRQQVEVLASVGTRHMIIAKVIGVGVDTLRAKYRSELDEGRERCGARIIDRLYTSAMSGSVAPLIFLAKTIVGLREGSVIEVREHEDDQTYRAVSLMTPEERRKLRAAIGQHRALIQTASKRRPVTISGSAVEIIEEIQDGQTDQ